jgi:K+-sensing histidine kinase KdpD
LSSIAHDLKTPLHQIMGTNEMLSEKLKEYESFTKMLSLQRNSCHLLKFLIDDLLDFSKFQFKKFTPKNKWFTVPDMVSEILTMIHY